MRFSLSCSIKIELILLNVAAFIINIKHLIYGFSNIKQEADSVN